MHLSNFCISGGKPLKLEDLSLPDPQFIVKLGMADQVQQIDLRDVLRVETGWSMTLAGGFLPLPDLVIFAMRDGSRHQFSVGLFGVIFGHRDFWVAHFNRALNKLRESIAASDSLLKLSKAVADRPRIPSKEPARRADPGSADTGKLLHSLTVRVGPLRASQPRAKRAPARPVL
jgi:hypothetical protein